MFLPGKAEIARVAQALESRSAGRWEIATLHGGTLTVASDPGAFTEFTVLLPFTQA